MGKPLVPYSDDESDDEVVEIPPLASAGDRKRKARKNKGPVDVLPLRCSRKLNKNDGFCTQEAQEQATEFSNIYLGTANDVNAAPPPHLPKDIIHSNGVGFLQIQPSVVSTAVLDEIDEE